MSKKDNSVPLFLSFEIERQARIKRSLVIQSCVRGTVRAFAEWLRILVLRSTQLARGLAAKRRLCSAIRELQQFDDRMLADIGVTTDRDAQFDGQIAAVNAQILSRASLLSIVAFRICAAASICLATGGALVAESATVVSPICAAADLRLTTLIEAHGEAQDVAAEILAQAFFTVMEARRACNQGHVELAIKLYESIPLRAAISHSQ
jgi:uncharacterized protein YjiS (DUF1127 family)